MIIFRPALVFFCLLFAPLMAMATVQAQATKPPLEKVSLQLKWSHQFQFAGYYAAQIKGFYRDEGLEVTIKERNTAKNNIQQVIEQESEYGIADSMIMLYQAKGAPVKIVSPIFQHSPQVFMTLKSSGINSLYKLANKEIAFYQKDTDGFPLLAMMHQNNVVPDLQRMAIKTGPEMLLNQQVEAFPGYLSNEPFLFKQQGIAINIIHPKNYGINLYGDLIFTHDHEVTHHPERVARFRRASIKGWEYALNHKDEIIDYIIDELNVNKSRAHLHYEAKTIEASIEPNLQPIGTLDPGRLEFIQKLFIEHNLMNSAINLSAGLYTPEDKRVTLTDKELAWIQANPEVKVAIDAAWHPLEFINSQDKLDGISKAFLDYLHSFTGLEFKPQTDLTWTESMAQVKAQKIAMLSAVIETPNRHNYLQFTPPYLEVPMVIATLKGENYVANLQQLIKRDQSVAVVEGYAAHELLKDTYPSLPLVLVNNPEEGLNAVNQEQAYAYIDNLAVVGHHIRQQGMTNLQISGDTRFNANVAMAVHNSQPDLYQIIKKALLAMNPKLKAELANRWIQVEYKTQVNWQQALYIGGPILIFALLVFFYSMRLKRLNKALLNTQHSLQDTNNKLNKVVVTDHLTMTYNRNHLDTVLKDEMSRCQRYQAPLSLLIFDLDNFKQVNDTHGHLSGDNVLIQVSQATQDCIRQSDTFGRWGGEEFLIILPNTELAEATLVAEKIRLNIKALRFPENFTQTVSIGLASCRAGLTHTELVQEADSCLYQAKRSGKDRVVA